jgi:hypothetical protein
VRDVIDSYALQFIPADILMPVQQISMCKMVPAHEVSVSAQAIPAVPFPFTMAASAWIS